MTLMLISFHILIGHPAGSSIHLTADYRLYSLFPAFFIKLHNAEHGSVVCDGQAVHTKLLCPCHHVFNAGCTVQQAVFRV